jgi:hypothetical protein
MASQISHRSTDYLCCRQALEDFQELVVLTRRCKVIFFDISGKSIGAIITNIVAM